MLPSTAFAESSAGVPASPKTETVYVNLDSTGATGQINVVNTFDVSSGETIHDYGDYVEVKNLTDTAELAVDGNSISVVASKDTFYYQGRLEQTDLPWAIAIRYFLNGAELTADEIAGKSGEFELRIDIQEGSERYKAFFEQYMMQISLTLNKDLFANIQSDDGTVNIVGKTANVSYTHAMNTEASYALWADVHDFEMGAIQIQAASMGDMGLELDDGLLDAFGSDSGGEFDQLIEATGALSENAQKLADGSDAFYSGIRGMDTQADGLSSGIGELYSLSGELSNGASAFGAGLSDFSSSLNSISVASREIAEGLETLNQQVSALPSPNPELVAYAQTLMGSSDPNLAALAGSYLAQNEVIAQLSSAVIGLNTVYTQFNAALQGGADISALTSGYSQIQGGLVGLSTALGQVNSSVGEALVPGVTEMLSSYELLNDGTGKLAEAISELDSKAADIPDELQSRIDEELEKIFPSESEKQSFVSKDAAADSVLFIMQTDEITAPSIAVDDVSSASKPETFWDKLLNLFGLWQPE
jgi:methyl-accepting chemotaxis protein